MAGYLPSVVLEYRITRCRYLGRSTSVLRRLEALRKKTLFLEHQRDLFLDSDDRDWEEIQGHAIDK